MTVTRSIKGGGPVAVCRCRPDGTQRSARHSAAPGTAHSRTRTGVRVRAKRLIGESTCGSLNRERRSPNDYEHKGKFSEAILYLCTTRLMLRRLACSLLLDII